MNPFEIGLDLERRWPAAGHLFLERVIPLLIPSTAGLGLKIVEHSAARTVLSLPLRRRTRNHVGSMYFGAQLTLAEITMGLLVFALYPPGPYGMLVKRSEADFLAKAKTDLHAVCAPEPQLLAALADGMAREGKAEGWLDVSVLDREEQEVTRVRFLAALKDFKRR